MYQVDSTHPTPKVLQGVQMGFISVYSLKQHFKLSEYSPVNKHFHGYEHEKEEEYYLLEGYAISLVKSH
jgi:hypothetical protein